MLGKSRCLPAGTSLPFDLSCFETLALNYFVQEYTYRTSFKNLQFSTVIGTRNFL